MEVVEVFGWHHLLSACEGGRGGVQLGRVGGVECRWRRIREGEEVGLLV